MMNHGFGIIETILVLVLGGMGGNELLDYADSAAFWQTRHVAVSAEAMLGELDPPEIAGIAALIAELGSPDFQTRLRARQLLTQHGAQAAAELDKATRSDDFEVAMAARAILREMDDAACDVQTRRLMAIRTLGELKAAEAVERLTALGNDGDPFIAQYAQRALANIAGQPLKRTTPSAEDLDSDLNLLPSSVSLVVQSRFDPTPAATLAELAARLPELPQMNPAEIVAQVTGVVSEAASRVGNVRLDAVTVGVSGDFGGGETGYLVVVGRGLYDPQRVKSYMTAQGAKPAIIDGMDALRIDDEFTWFFPDNRRLVLIGTPQAGRLGEMETTLVAALKSGRGTLRENAPLVKLIGGVNRTGPLCGAAVMTDTYRALDGVFEPVRDMSLSAEIKNRALSLTLRANGGDAEGMAQSAKTLDAGLAKLRAELAPLANMKGVERMFEPVVNVVNSIKIERDGATISISARFDNTGVLPVAPLLMMWGSVRIDRMEQVIVDP